MHYATSNIKAYNSYLLYECISSTNTIDVVIETYVCYHKYTNIIMHEVVQLHTAMYCCMINKMLLSFGSLDKIEWIVSMCHQTVVSSDCVTTMNESSVCVTRLLPDSIIRLCHHYEWIVRMCHQTVTRQYHQTVSPDCYQTVSSDCVTRLLPDSIVRLCHHYAVLPFHSCKFKHDTNNHFTAKSEYNL